MNRVSQPSLSIRSYVIPVGHWRMSKIRESGYMDLSVLVWPLSQLCRFCLISRSRKPWNGSFIKVSKLSGVILRSAIRTRQEERRSCNWRRIYNIPCCWWVRTVSTCKHGVWSSAQLSTSLDALASCYRIPLLSSQQRTAHQSDSFTRGWEYCGRVIGLSSGNQTANRGWLKDSAVGPLSSSDPPRSKAVNVNTKKVTRSISSFIFVIDSVPYLLDNKWWSALNIFIIVSSIE